jgi:hypothetical protein
MSYSTFLSNDEQERRIKYLEEELFKARWTILRLAPEKFHRILQGYYSCESREDTYGWDERVAEQVIGHAEPLPPEKGSYFSERAYCPLCGEGSLTPYESGFSLPEGLRRHLVGYGNTHQCVFTEAALKLAHDHWNGKFRAAEEAKRKQDAELLAARFRTETLYKIAPDVNPALIDDGQSYAWRPVRNESEMLWAEERLAELGFEMELDGRAKAYTRKDGESLVYADPRVKGEIIFRVYRLPLPKRGRSKRLQPSVFKLLDSWKHDIRSKYKARWVQAMGQGTATQT